MIFKKTKLLTLLLSAVLLLGAPAASFAAVWGGTAANAVWDGKTIDVSWYSKDKKEYKISTPAQLAGLAAIVNGIYNADITNIIGDKSVIVDNKVETTEEEAAGSNGNNKSTDVYHYGADSFLGKTVSLTADIDMGGVYNAASKTWSGPNYMPIGGQYLMEVNNSSTKLSSSFCGIFDGQGHVISNIYCERHCSTGNFGDGQSVALIGRLGVHDSDDAALRPENPTVRNVTVTGYIHANRSVGGIVGKIGKTKKSDTNVGGIVENCANFCSVSNTDAKGCGGIVGAGWNAGMIRNCYNAGDISTTYTCPTGGISGSNEITLENCYNIGTISARQDNYAMAIGTNNGGAPYDYVVKNCWYLKGSSKAGGYYSGGDNFNDGEKSASEMKSAAFLKTLGSAYTEDTYGLNDGFPVLKCQAENEKNRRDAAAAEKAVGWSDVKADSWYKEYVSFVTDNGYFDGITSNTFGPDNAMTRQMLVTALYRIAGTPEVSGNLAFTDVPASAAYYDAVLWANQNGVVNGITDTIFQPDGSITREQIATMFYRYAQYAKADTSVKGDLSKFKDVSEVSSYAKEGLQWCIGAGLIGGMTADTLSPKGTATRAQTAKMVKSFVEFTAA